MTAPGARGRGIAKRLQTVTAEEGGTVDEAFVPYIRYIRFPDTYV